jgi:hypothetical protein
VIAALEPRYTGGEFESFSHHTTPTGDRQDFIPKGSNKATVSIFSKLTETSNINGVIVESYDLDYITHRGTKLEGIKSTFTSFTHERINIHRNGPLAAIDLSTINPPTVILEIFY